VVRLTTESIVALGYPILLSYSSSLSLLRGLLIVRAVLAALRVRSFKDLRRMRCISVDISSDEAVAFTCCLRVFCGARLHVRRRLESGDGALREGASFGDAIMDKALLVICGFCICASSELGASIVRS
jgi:hypothetical protein